MPRACRQLIECGRERCLASVAAEVVRARRVERHEQHVGRVIPDGDPGCLGGQGSPSSPVTRPAQSDRQDGYSDQKNARCCDAEAPFHVTETTLDSFGREDPVTGDVASQPRGTSIPEGRATVDDLLAQPAHEPVSTIRHAARSAGNRRQRSRYFALPAAGESAQAAGQGTMSSSVNVSFPFPPSTTE